MNELVKYICVLFGIQLDSKIALLDIEDDIGSVIDHVKYVKFLKDNFNLVDIKFLTAYQKFLNLTKRYKQIEEDIKNIQYVEKIKTRAEEICAKVRNVEIEVLNNQSKNHYWSGFKIKDTGENFFSDKDISALEAIGTPLQCVNIQRSVSGKDMLDERLEVIFKHKVAQIGKPVEVLKIGNVLSGTFTKF